MEDLTQGVITQGVRHIVSQKSDGRYFVKETKRQGRIAHHHADATVPHIVALLGSTFHAAKIRSIFESSKFWSSECRKKFIFSAES